MQQAHHEITQHDSETQSLDIPVGQPIELVALAIKDLAVRCKVVGTGTPITLKKSRWEVPGEILTVMPSKVWRFKRTNYIAGDVVGKRIDIDALKLEPLKLTSVGVWDPAEEQGEPAEADLYAMPFTEMGPRPQYEMAQVLPRLPGQDLDDPDSDPILEASEYFGCGAEQHDEHVLSDCLVIL